MQYAYKPSSRAISIPAWALVILFFIYALPGNFGHDPWRGDDVLYIDVAFEMLRNGDWLVPHIAGLPYFDWPPLTYWIAATLGGLLNWLMPVHDAIRLTTIISLGLAVWALRATTRKLVGVESGNAAFLLSIGSIGLLIHAHEAQPQITLMAAVACTFYGLATMHDDLNGNTEESARAHPIRGAIITGVSTGAAILTAGLVGAALTLPLWFVMPLAYPKHRQGTSARAYLLAFVIAALLAASWPIALAIFQPGALHQWWRQEITDIAPHAGNLANTEALTQLLAWFTWPLWPVAGWSLWRRRKQLRDPLCVLSLTGLVVAAWLVMTTGSLRAANVVPLLPPLILLAAAELPRLRRGAANAFDWFGIMSFCCIGLFLWLAWLAMHLGWPSPLARNIVRLAPDFVHTWSWWTVSIAIVISAGWIVALVRVPYFPLRGAVHMALGVTLAWALAIVLWQDWFDYDRNYRPIAREIAVQVREQHGGACLATLGAGDVQRAAFYYFQRLRVDPRSSAFKHCPMLIAYSSARNALPVPDANWQKTWSKERGRGRQSERFALYRRID
ncbi:MAG TPA: hypothetical protein VFW00_14665 [Rhodocyclaceae bacterium]|nr:hypothetical protein [Rhodocyclaceae bacterium]